MSDQQPEIPETGVQQPTTSLPESKELLSGQVAVYIIIDRTRLAQIERDGFKIENNTRENTHSKLEEVFETARQKTDIPVSRTDCIFAHPFNPGRNTAALGFDPKTEVIIKANIDPANCWVAPADYYSGASEQMIDWGMESARNVAESYWQATIPLEHYLVTYDPVDPSSYLLFSSFPEVLIPHNIPASELSLIQPESPVYN